MMLKALITEQLDANGTLKTLRLHPGSDQHIVVAFAHEYAEPMEGPFHFLEPEDERRFRESFAQCRARLLSLKNFSKNRDVFQVKSLRWSGIPTERNYLSYYALSLPEFAIPRRISITDPHRSHHEYTRTVRRNDDQKRYVIYLECSSRVGRFDFELNCDFVIDRDGFSASEYQDSHTSEYGRGQDEWRIWIEREEAEKIQGFFAEAVKMKSNPWVSGSFYLVAFLSVITLLLVAGQIVNVVVLPVVLIGGLIAIGVIGALQLRNDSKLSQKSFLSLMALSYRQLPFIGAKKE